jgi:hypothetical protein
MEIPMVPRLVLLLAVIAAGASACTSNSGTPQGARYDPKVYPGHLSNMMDCKRITLAQRQFINLQRYGCADIPTPSDAGR